LFPAVIMIDCCVRCINGCIMKSDMQNKGETEMLEEHPPQKKEDEAGAGLLRWRSP
jgi:hypothetical protein